MTASTVQSGLLSNLGSQIAAPTLNAAAVDGGKLRVAAGTIALATTSIDEANDVVMLCGLPTGAVVHSIRLAADDLDSNATPALAFNLGLFPEVDSAIAAVKDADAYASAITLGQAATAFTEYAFEARNINLCGQKVYQDAGDTSDPDDVYYLGLSVSTAAATAAAGDLSFIVEYSVE